VRLLEEYIQHKLGKGIGKEYSNILDNTGLVECMLSRQVDFTEYDIGKTDKGGPSDNTLLKASILDCSLFSQFKSLSKAIVNEPDNTKDVPSKPASRNKEKSPEKKVAKVNKLNLEDLVNTIKLGYNKIMQCPIKGFAEMNTQGSVHTPTSVKRKGSHGVTGDIKLLEPVLHCQTEPDKNEYNTFHKREGSKSKFNDINAKRYILSKPSKFDSQGSTSCSGVHSGTPNQTNSMDKKNNSENKGVEETKVLRSGSNNGSAEGNHFYKVSLVERVTERTDSVSKATNYYTVKTANTNIKSLYYVQKTQKREERSKSASKDKLNLYLNKKNLEPSANKERSSSATRKRQVVYEISNNFRPVSTSPGRDNRKTPLNNFNKNLTVKGKDTTVSKISRNNSNVNSITNQSIRNGVIKKPSNEYKPNSISLKKHIEPSTQPLQYKVELKKNKVFK
jgi:hypothetical protein